MQEFKTPEPITLVVELAAGDVSIDASDRATTAVDVRPSNPERRSDVQAAEQMHVEFAGGGLLVKSTRRWRSFCPVSDGRPGNVHPQPPPGLEAATATAVATPRSRG